MMNVGIMRMRVRERRMRVHVGVRLARRIVGAMDMLVVRVVAVGVAVR